MKILWSWQSDVPGDIGRHFVRDAIAATIEALKQPETVEQPTEANRRGALGAFLDELFDLAGEEHTA